MTFANLERTGEAQAMLERLEDVMSDPEKDWRDNEVMRALFEEAKQLLERADVRTDPLESTEGDN